MPMAHPDRFLLAGVMGWPVMHSRSPMLHGYWLKRHNLAGTYVPLAIRPEGLVAALRALHPLGFAGCNLTIPHKERAMAIVDEVDALAKAIGAISCVVVRPDGSLSGTNNDCYGFIQNVKQEQPGWRADAGPIVVIGAGGGSRAVCYGLAQEGAREIRLVNRTLARAKGIAVEFGGPIKALPWEQRQDALEPGPAGVEGVVRDRARGDAGAEGDGREDDLGEADERLADGGTAGGLAVERAKTGAGDRSRSGRGGPLAAHERCALPRDRARVARAASPLKNFIPRSSPQNLTTPASQATYRGNEAHQRPDVLARCLLEKAGRNYYENNHKAVGVRPAGSGARAAPASRTDRPARQSPLAA